MQQHRILPQLITRIFVFVFVAIMLVLAVITFHEYPGSGYIYLLFTVISNYLLWLGFRRNAIYFDTFIGVLFYLGFWLKLSIRVAFTEGRFVEQTGNFDGSGAAFDRGLLVASCGLFALVTVSLVRERLFQYDKKPSAVPSHLGTYCFYRKHRKLLLATFAVLCLSVAITNIVLGIYQRGQVSQTVLPLGLNGVYKWLLQFGLASFGALILHYEYVVAQRTSITGWLFALLEGFTSSVSLLSRGMVLNWSALFFGFFRSVQFNRLKIKPTFLVVVVLLFVLLFGSSVFSVNYLRLQGAFAHVAQEFSSDRDWGWRGNGSSENARMVNNMGKSLFIDRWVGMEGVLAVTSSGRESWDLWIQGWREQYFENRTSFFDLNMVDSPYLKADSSVHHYISLPGIIAFCFYSGSFVLLFGCMLLVGAIGAVIDVAVYRLGGKNLILCSLFAQVVAYRFSSFGYVPSQSYLLFGSLFLNLVIIFGVEKLFAHKLNHVSGDAQSG